MEKKVSLYKSLAKKFKGLGYRVNKGNYLETVGYDFPTKQYWFDVTLFKKKKIKTTMHFYFGDNRNGKPEIEIWETLKIFGNITDKRIL
jgi:hypothetical protein